jgi:hypothetical protein
MATTIGPIERNAPFHFHGTRFTLRILVGASLIITGCAEKIFLAPLINPMYKPLVQASMIAAGCAIGSLLTPWEGIRIIGTTMLTGISYGIINDMIACRDCIEYFTVGHFFDGTRLANRPLLSLNPNLNALAWGTIATWHVCALAGTFFSLLARVPLPRIVTKISARKLFPYLSISAAASLIFSHIKSRLAQKAMQSHPYFKYAVPLRLQAGWETCNIRNTAGYTMIVKGGLILSIGILAARIALSWYQKAHIVATHVPGPDFHLPPKT